MLRRIFLATICEIAGFFLGTLIGHVGGTFLGILFDSVRWQLGELGVIGKASYGMADLSPRGLEIAYAGGKTAHYLAPRGMVLGQIVGVLLGGVGGARMS